MNPDESSLNDGYIDISNDENDCIEFRTTR